MKKLFEISSDCLDIVQRIKSIDNNYFVLYNLEQDKFELHNHSQVGNSYCLTFPYDTLDERAYLFTLKTRVQNSDKIFAEMDEDNKKLEEKQIKEVLNGFIQG